MSIATAPSVADVGGEIPDLRRKAILIALNIGEPSISARSATLTREAADKHDADPSSVRGLVTKLEAEARKEVVAIKNKARTIVKLRTVPWDNNGYRLCPASEYPKLISELEALRDEHYDAVQRLVARHSELQRNYHKRVNDLANEIAFPTKRELEEGHTFEWSEMQVPNLSDIRLQYVDKKVVDDIRDRMEQAMSDRLAGATLDLVERMREAVAKVKEQTADEDKKIYDVLITNVEKMVDNVTVLNITNDPEISRLIARVRTEIASVDVEAVRKDPKVRKQAYKAATGVLADLKKFQI